MGSAPYVNVSLPFFFLLGPFVFTKVVTCRTSGSSVFSTDMVRISKFFGSHFIVSVPKSPILACLYLTMYLWTPIHFTLSNNALASTDLTCIELSTTLSSRKCNYFREITTSIYDHAQHMDTVMRFTLIFSIDFTSELIETLNKFLLGGTFVLYKNTPFNKSGIVFNMADDVAVAQYVLPDSGASVRLPNVAEAQTAHFLFDSIGKSRFTGRLPAIDKSVANFCISYE